MTNPKREEKREPNYRYLFDVLVDALLEDHFDYNDTDALTCEEILVQIGVLEKTTATAEDAKSDWASEWGIDEGDPCTKVTGFGREALTRLDALKKGRDDAG